MQRVKGVEKFFLRGLFTGDELNIVNQQDVNGAIFFAERFGGVSTNRVDEVVGELLGRDIEDV